MPHSSGGSQGPRFYGWKWLLVKPGAHIVQEIIRDIEVEPVLSVVFILTGEKIAAIMYDHCQQIGASPKIKCQVGEDCSMKRPQNQNGFFMSQFSAVQLLKIGRAYQNGNLCQIGNILVKLHGEGTSSMMP